MNIFSVLGDSDDEEQQKTEVKNAKAAKKDNTKATPASKPDAAAAKPAPAKTDAKNSTKPKEPSAASANGNKPKPAGNNKPTPAPAAADADQEPAKDNNRGGLPRGKDHLKRNENHKGALKNEEEPNRRPKHDFDRRSGTGRGKELSKDGRGKFGFGNVNQEAQEGEKNKAAVEGVSEAVEGAEGEGEQNAEPAEPAEPEPVTYSLDEYLAQREAARAKALTVGSREVRKVETVFKGMTTKTETESEEFIPAVKLASNKNAIIKDQRSTAKTAVADIAFKFDPISDRDRDVRVRTDAPKREFNDRPRSGGRGGRGGDRRANNNGNNGGNRGEGGRGGGGGGRGGSVFKADDFPTL